MRSSRASVPGGFGFPLGFLLTVMVTFLAVAAGATTHPLRSVVALAAVIAVVATLSTLPAALATAAAGWAVHAGFVLGRHGDLVFTQQSGQDAILLGVVAVLAFAAANAIRAPRMTKPAHALRRRTSVVVCRLPFRVDG